MHYGDILLHVILWSSTHLQGIAKDGCQTEETVPKGCPDSWEELTPPRACIKHIIDIPYKTFDEAQEYCEELGGTQFVSLSSLHNNKAGELVAGHEPWLGLSKTKDQKTFYWVSGQKVSRWVDWNVAKKEPNGQDERNCAYFDSDGKWSDGDCNEKRSWICQKERTEGPRELKMSVNWHGAPGQMFTGRPIVVTCSAFIKTYVNITWSAYNNGFSIDVSDHIKTRYELARTSEGYCRNQTISTFSAPAQHRLSGRDLTCSIGGHAVDWSICPINARLMGFCHRLYPKITITSAPKGRPNVTMKYVDDTTVQINCTIEPGDSGELSWVVYFNSGPKVLDYDDKHIIEKRKGCYTFGGKFVWEDPTCDPEFTIEHSQLLIPLRRSLSGGSVACFAYKLKQAPVGLHCNETKNEFCARTEKIKEILGNEPGFDLKLDWRVMIIALVAALVCSLCMCCCCRKKKKKPKTVQINLGDAEGEDGIIDLHDVLSQGSSESSSGSGRSGSS